MKSSLENKSQIRILFFIKDISVFGKSFIASSIDSDFIQLLSRISTMIYLTAIPPFRKSFNTGLKNIMIPHIRPTIPKIILLYSRNIRKTVMIGIMSHRFIFIMS